MVTSEQFNKLMASLKSLESKLDILVRLQKASLPKPNITKAERSVLKLCDKKHTVEDIVKETGKSKSSVENLLSQLRKKGQIITVRSKDKVVYGKI